MVGTQTHDALWSGSSDHIPKTKIPYYRDENVNQTGITYYTDAWYVNVIKDKPWNNKWAIYQKIE